MAHARSIRHGARAARGGGVAEGAPLFALAVRAPYDPHMRRFFLCCLLAGALAAPTTNLQSALVSVRSFCGAQIKRVRTHRVDAATAGLDGEAAKRAADKATRDRNNEIALAIANFTGLTS